MRCFTLLLLCSCGDVPYQEVAAAEVQEPKPPSAADVLADLPAPETEALAEADTDEEVVPIPPDPVALDPVVPDPVDPDPVLPVLDSSGPATDLPQAEDTELLPLVSLTEDTELLPLVSRLCGTEETLVEGVCVTDATIEHPENHEHMTVQEAEQQQLQVQQIQDQAQETDEKLELLLEKIAERAKAGKFLLTEKERLALAQVQEQLQEGE